MQLPPNEGLALVAWTHDLQNGDGSKEGNVYFECNRMLRLRSAQVHRVVVIAAAPESTPRVPRSTR